MIAGWFVVVIAGFGLTIMASSRTVLYASALGQVTRVPPLIIGLTLLAVGTDLPEIANSIVSSASGHGDLNVGDSVGSGVTQATLVLGLLPFLGPSLRTPGTRRYATGLFAALGLVLVGLLVADDRLSRLDVALLVVAWLAGTWAAHRIVNRSIASDVQEFEVDDHLAGFPVLTLAVRTFLGLVVIGVGATLTVAGVIRISEEIGVSEFLIGFFALSIGTSMPELVLALTAVRRERTDRRTRAVALGDLLRAVRNTMILVLIAAMVSCWSPRRACAGPSRSKRPFGVASSRNPHDWCGGRLGRDGRRSGAGAASQCETGSGRVRSSAAMRASASRLVISARRAGSRSCSLRSTISSGSAARSNSCSCPWMSRV